MCSKKARDLWRLQGDQSSKYFQRLVEHLNTTNNINSLLINGRKVTDIERIKTHSREFYVNLYAEDSFSKPNTGGMDLQSLSHADSLSLEVWFTIKEVKQAIDDLASKKTLGPDGFPIRFYSFCWPFMKNDIMDLFNDFFDNGFFYWRLNTTFITLVPKSEGEKSIGEFRPIALLCGVYKILAKVLTNRLKPHLSTLVSDYQCALVEGRHIQDLSLMVNELLDSKQQEKSGSLLLRLDFLKAFDRVSWDFLKSIVFQMGFGTKWVGWLLTCRKTSSFLFY